MVWDMSFWITDPQKRRDVPEAFCPCVADCKTEYQARSSQERGMSLS
jgi:hypothetical protein